MYRLFLFMISFLLVGTTAYAQPSSLNARADCGLGREVAAVRLFRLTRFRDEEQMQRAITQGLLAEVPSNGPGYTLGNIGGHSPNPTLYRRARPFTLYFLGRLGRAFEARFPGRRFIVTSLVRSETYQRALMRGNGNAAAITRTSHTTGATMDIAWNTLSQVHRTWMQRYLAAEERAGFVQATQERVQRVFHIMVFPHRVRNLACR